MLLHCSSTTGMRGKGDGIHFWVWDVRDAPPLLFHPGTGGKKAGIHPRAPQPPAEMMFYLFSPSRTFCHLQNVSLGLGCRARPTKPCIIP